MMLSCYPGGNAMHEPSFVLTSATTAESTTLAALTPYTRDELERTQALVGALEFGGSAGFHACQAHLTMDTIEAINHIQTIFSGIRRYTSQRDSLLACPSLHETCLTLFTILAESERWVTPEIMRYVLIAFLRAKAGVFDRNAPDEKDVLVAVDQALIAANMLR